MSLAPSGSIPKPFLSAYGRRLLRLGSIRGGGLILSDLSALVLAFLAGGLPVLLFSSYFAGDTYAELFSENTPLRAVQLLAFTGMLVLWLFHRGHYGLRVPFWTEVQHLAYGCAMALLADGFLQFALKNGFSRLWLVHTWLLAVPLMLLMRRGMRLLLRAVGLWEVPALVVGTSARIDDAVELLRSERSLGYSVAATETLESLKAAWPGSWLEACRRVGAQIVVLAADDADMASHRGLMNDLTLGGIPYIHVQSLGGMPVIAVESHHVLGQDLLLISAQSPLSRPLARGAKTVFDYAGALLILIFALPFLGVVALLIRRDGGPVFYVHTRIGKDGVPFRCLKFRTMVTDADARLAGLLERDADARAEWAAARKLRRDPRVTAVGARLRAYSLDELPQLVNVLRGEMSLVGPRPVTAEELERFGDDLSFYTHTRPGITGLWQVSGRSATDFVRRTQLDAWYVKNWSLWLDVVILLRTVPAVLSRHGAY